MTDRIHKARSLYVDLSMMLQENRDGIECLSDNNYKKLLKFINQANLHLSDVMPDSMDQEDSSKSEEEKVELFEQHPDSVQQLQRDIKEMQLDVYKLNKEVSN